MSAHEVRDAQVIEAPPRSKVKGERCPLLIRADEVIPDRGGKRIFLLMKVVEENGADSGNSGQ